MTLKDFMNKRKSIRCSVKSMVKNGVPISPENTPYGQALSRAQYANPKVKTLKYKHVK